MRKIKISPGQNLWDTMRDGRFTLCATFLMGQWLNYEVRIWLEFNACAAWNKSQFSALTDLKWKSVKVSFCNLLKTCRYLRHRKSLKCIHFSGFSGIGISNFHGPFARRISAFVCILFLLQSDLWYHERCLRNDAFFSKMLNLNLKASFSSQEWMSCFELQNDEFLKCDYCDSFDLMCCAKNVSLLSHWLEIKYELLL